MLDFLNRNAGAIQALGAVLTVLLALAALLGVKIQIDAAERIQREQSARDIYREYLNLAVNKPEFSGVNYCAIVGTPQAAAYNNFVEYILYTAEQTTSVDPDWEGVFESLLEDHAQLVCTIDEIDGYSPPVASMLQRFKAAHCKSVARCN